jgi:Tol biopolymer transport system component
VANLWLAAPTGGRGVRQITFGSGEEGSVTVFDPAQDSTIIFDMLKDASAQVWTIGADGTGQRPVTSGPRPSFNSKFRPGAGVFFNRAEEDLTLHIWRSDPDGENARQVTSGNGELLVGVSPDGRAILFQQADNPDVLWSISSDGGKPVRLAVSARNSAFFSPDGSRIFHTLVHAVEGRGAFTPQVIPAKGGEPALSPALPPRTINVLWTPDGTGFTYLHALNGQRNLFRLRLDGGKPEEITRFAEGRIMQHRWSPDGKRLLIRRRIENADNLWVTGADGSNPVAITDFETGDISDMKWTRDGSRVLFSYGESSQNVVLVRNFR